MVKDKENNLQIITVNVPRTIIELLDNLSTYGGFPSRSEIIRHILIEKIGELVRNEQIIKEINKCYSDCTPENPDPSILHIEGKSYKIVATLDSNPNK